MVIGAESYAISPEKFAKVIEKVGSPDKKNLVQATAEVIAPAKKEDGATIAMSQNESLSVPVKTVRKMPDPVEFELLEIDEPHPDADVEFRAT